jgi:hypothetical protein
MKETLELRINYDYAYLLFGVNEGKDLGQLSKSIKVVEISMDDPRYKDIATISKLVKEKYNKSFFFGWRINRKYSKAEINSAILFHLKIKTTFEPAGEECGTIYDETVACEICGANRRQVGPLKLNQSSIPKKDISRTIAGEIVVSERFVKEFNRRNLKGALLEPVDLGIKIPNYYQLTGSEQLKVTSHTITGDDPFEKSIASNGGTYNISGYEVKLDKEVYVCPKGHLIGLNLLSEPYIQNNSSIDGFDLFETEQKTGVKRGLLRPTPIYLCSQAFRKMVEEEKFTGFDFEIAHIET